MTATISLINRVSHAGEAERAQHRVGHVGQVGVDAPDQLHHVLENEEQCERQDQRDDLAPIGHPTDECAFKERPDSDADEDAAEQQHQVAQGWRKDTRTTRATGPQSKHQPRAGVGAQSVQTAMRHVQDAHDAVDEGESGRNQEQI
jgi:hypothetical protein